MPLIDDAGAKAISKWFNNKQDTPHIVSVNDMLLKINSDRELATLELILMRNSIKYKVDDITLSKN